jgi:4-carboxymuconolactone decarboxylase
MQLRFLGIGIAILSGLALAQAPRDLKLRGDRFKPLTYDKLTPEQKIMIEDLYKGERGGANGPFNVWLRSPEVGNLAQKVGAQLRFHSSLPNRLNEFGIIMTARFWNAEYEWQAHKRLALKAGLSPAIVDAVATGKRPPSMQPDEEAVYNFGHELLQTRQVGDAAFKAMVDKFGERGAVDLTSLMGYYCMVSMILNIDRYPLPDGAHAELKPLP